MASQTAPAAKLDQLPEAARDRIAQLRQLFIERSKGNLTEIRQLLDRRQIPDERDDADSQLAKLAHSLVGASGIFGFPHLGESAFRLETALRDPGCGDAERETLIADLVGLLEGLS